MITITYNCSPDKNLVVASDLLSDAIANSGNYTKIDFKITYNCCTCFEFSIVKNMLGTDWEQETDQYLIVGSTVQIKEFAVSNFSDGIYTVNMTIYDDVGVGVEDENCIFFDCVTKCLVGAQIEKLLADDIDSEIHMLHWGLVTASGCSCNCSELCELYKRLTNLLSIYPECKTC